MFRLRKHLETIAPLRLANSSWDNVGLLVQAPYPKDKANKVLLTIDLTPFVMEEVFADPDIGSIVAYHPVIFKGLKRLTTEDKKSELILQCIAEGISIYCPHTALDACNPGINDWLVSCFDDYMESREPIVPDSKDPTCGMGRILTLKDSIDIDDAIDRVKKHIGLQMVRFAPSTSLNREIKTIAVCAGSGSSILFPLKTDLYITGEMSHHEILEAVGQGTHVILCEHSNSERGYLSKVLQPKLQELFDNDGQTPVKVVVSKMDADPIQIR